MPHNILEIDHLMCGVRSPQQAGETLQRMGFTVTPFSVIEAMGLGNRCVLFPSATPGAANYLELMGIVSREKVPANMQQTLAGGDCVKSIVLATDDCNACYTSLHAASFSPPTQPIHLARKWVLAPGDTVHPEFDVLLPMPAPLVFNVCQHKTLPLYLRPEWTSHPNGAIGLDAVIAYTPDATTTIGFYERLFGRAGTREPGGLMAVSPARVALRIGDSTAIAREFGGLEVAGTNPQFIGISVRVLSIAALRDRLDTGGIPHIALGLHRALVSARDACGNFIEFFE